MKSRSAITIAAALLLAATVDAQQLLIHPYVQPGNGSTLGAADVKVVAWVTDQKEAPFVVEYGAGFAQKATPKRTALNLGENQNYFTYAAQLTGLPLNAQVAYRVKQGEKVVGEASFATRRTPDHAVRFVVTGDMGSGKSEQQRVAHQMYLAKPEFLLVAGDIVYSKGRVSEYFSNFWNQYNNTPKPDPNKGAPLLRGVPLYGIIGNHDVGATNLASFPDGFGAFYFFHPPLNGPKNYQWVTPIVGPPDKVAAFKEAAGVTYPALCNYSFDNGPAHFLCLDANRYAMMTDATLRQWIQDDLTSTTARWKFVFFHQPGFNSSDKHYTEQRTRLLAPLFEKCGVDVVFAGHVHNYQRSKPLKFQPHEPDKLSIGGRVDGRFTLDEKFDGKENTRPNGVIYIVTGAGGAGLYDPDFTDNPEKWAHDPKNWAPFTAKFVSNRHSFSVVDVDANQFTLRQVDLEGKEVDRWQITKP
ncbi:MAG: metallophosphoesterase [Verrucomicrobiota bacterium]